MVQDGTSSLQMQQTHVAHLVNYAGEYRPYQRLPSRDLANDILEMQLDY